MIDLVTGGAASGKSAYAEELALSLAKETKRPLLYLATMHRDQSKETIKRIDRHRALRSGKGFETIELESHLERAQLCQSVILLEDLSNLLTNELYREKRSEAVIPEALWQLGSDNELVIVTNEIFSDGRCYDPFTEHFIRALGMLNRQIAAHPLCRSVTEVVASIPVRIK